MNPIHLLSFLHTEVFSFFFTINNHRCLHGIITFWLRWILNEVYGRECGSKWWLTFDLNWSSLKCSEKQWCRTMLQSSLNSLQPYPIDSLGMHPDRYTHAMTPVAYSQFAIFYTYHYSAPRISYTLLNSSLLAFQFIQISHYKFYVSIQNTFIIIFLNNIACCLCRKNKEEHTCFQHSLYLKMKLNRENIVLSDKFVIIHSFIKKRLEKIITSPINWELGYFEIN